jgi:hypothetical protein
MRHGGGQAGGCKEALEAYPWSSYPYFTGKRRKPPEWLVREKVLKTWGIDPEQAGRLRAYREKIEKFMGLELDPSGELYAQFQKQIKRGWYLGGEAFCAKLTRRLEQQKSGCKLEGDQRRSHGEQEAKRLLRKALSELGVSLPEMKKCKSTDVEKQAVAWLLHAHTTVTLSWVAETLSMGHRVNASRALSKFRAGKGREIRKLKDRMLRCTA